jgi:hypothetical protein
MIASSLRHLSVREGCQVVRRAALTSCWRKSSYSSDGCGANCVEVGPVRGAILVRDTKDTGTGPVLRVTPATWTRFTRAVRTSAAVR